jgi:hypothetical protein
MNDKNIFCAIDEYINNNNDKYLKDKLCKLLNEQSEDIDILNVIIFDKDSYVFCEVEYGIYRNWSPWGKIQIVMDYEPGNNWSGKSRKM